VAIYRTQSRRPLFLTGAVALVVGLVIGFALGSATAPGLASQLASARAEVRPILTSLDVVRIEYASLLTGGDSGSPDAIARAQEAFRARQATFDLIGRAAAMELEQALERVAGLVAAKAPQAEVDTAIDAAEAAAREIAGEAPASG